LGKSIDAEDAEELQEVAKEVQLQLQLIGGDCFHVREHLAEVAPPPRRRENSLNAKVAKVAKGREELRTAKSLNAEVAEVSGGGRRGLQQQLQLIWRDCSRPGVASSQEDPSARTPFNLLLSLFLCVLSPFLCVLCVDAVLRLPVDNAANARPT
jgi:hypothetical protein